MKDEKNLFPNFASTLRKWAPGFALAILTIILMIFFKSQRGDVSKLIEKGKGELVKLYSQGLQPLVDESPISSEDVFNFALYRNLPINRERNKILQIDADSTGNQYFEIKPANISQTTINLQKFKDYLELETEESERFDSLLSSYKYDVYASILTKKGNTIAVDPNIINLHSALMADIARFAQNKNPKKAEQFIPIDFTLAHNADVDELVKGLRTTDQYEYVFFTPDTIFNLACVVDKEKIKSDIKEQVQLAEKGNAKSLPYLVEVKNPATNSTGAAGSVKFSLDKNLVKVFPEMNYSRVETAPEIAKLRDELGKITFKLSSDIMDVAKVSGEMAVLVNMREFNKGIDISVGDDFHFEFNLEDFENNMEEIASEFENYDARDWEAFGEKISKLYGEYAETISDSLTGKEKKDIRIEMQELKQEMKLVKEEIAKKRKLSKPIRKK
ncbi:MAG: hypothetical protein KKA84_05765 [Bacteroidetes bacterium]|nr:hypothetical protein [Bacteroidota bacterium]